MTKQVLTRGHRELFRRTPDESFDSLDALWQHCQRQKSESQDIWEQPEALRPVVVDNRLELGVAGGSTRRLNSWSFTQLCQLAGVSRETVNRLTPQTAATVFEETMPPKGKPLQVHVQGPLARSVHAASYTRLHNIELLSVVREFATDFQPPQQAGGEESSGGTGLYCGEQDMFCFLVDPAGWTEIGGEAFAPGLFLWNSEVGKRSVGIQTFWFQAICRNHIVWDAVEVIDFSRKHTANVGEAVGEIRRLIHRLVERRDERRDRFAEVLAKAMQSSLGHDEEEVSKVLSRHGITRALAKEALTIARQSGRFTIFSVVDALTRLSGQIVNAGDRTEADQAASSLLALAK
ncbi:MAG: DUF932 domain-containing protein [Phycisphaeraceae bacterium]|jgi:predicted GNAT family acetyltransferase|nr:DUF932 domain-containing protein [Phycisphaeraceae bacterium]